MYIYGTAKNTVDKWRLKSDTSLRQCVGAPCSSGLGVGSNIAASIPLLAIIINIIIIIIIITIIIINIIFFIVSYVTLNIAPKIKTANLTNVMAIPLVKFAEVIPGGICICISQFELSLNSGF